TEDKEVAALAERVRQAVSGLGEPFVLSAEGRVLMPRDERSPKDDRVEKGCHEAVNQLGGREREAAVRKIIASCEGVRDAQDRWVWPVLALPVATQESDVPARLVSWVESHKDRLRPAERELLLADVKTATGLSADQRARLTAALGGAASLAGGSDAAVSRAARSETVQRASRAATETEGTPVRIEGTGLTGSLVAIRGGGFAGWLVTPETLARSLSAEPSWGGASPGFSARVITEMPARDARTPEGVAFIADGLGVAVRFESPAALRERTTRSERLLGGIIASGVLLALVLSFVLYRRMRETRRTSELRTSFVAGVSHELRTPLASVRMLSELLAEGRVDESERAEVAEALAREAKRMGETVDRFMAYAKSERGKLVAEKKPTDLAAIVSDRVGAFRERHPEARVEVEAPPLEVAVDRPQIEIVVDNLLENALKYAPDGQPYRVTLGQAEQAVVLSVSDSGPGVPRNIAQKIFEAFQRGDERLSRATSGTGLGLFLVRAIARAHGGDVELDASVDKGACFRVTLPRTEVDKMETS
ncbi:MAG: HAMP domain-containing histidine kinase, partial [Myxococcales bacterium]|nr:HAMP domain-containing histidine kinase [Myxococcales bacterium]